MAKRKFSHSRGPSPYLNTLQLVQAHFGLSQQRVADLLQVPRSTLALDQRGVRLMPSAASLRLDTLRQQLPAPDGLVTEPTPSAAKLTEDEREQLRMRRWKIELDEYPLQKELERLQTRLAQAHLRLHVLPTLRAAFPDEPGQRWLESFAAEAHTILEYDAGTPALLELRLRVLAFEREEIHRLLNSEAG